ncbi:MAG: 2-dehydro-3-deoxygalactonokinase [Phenylobacterium sp.]|jgi:2-dehydro-3-deoxygalactonokinase|uniref:2-dehydro-3-deoxygalactonokinase n=1 Tax=Phenylobacterium sp. TaxID=1871053 RepID=UPI002A308E10|nr:2-dehydro-3-deoxygalactonokinase [Phenylobacterium sp.]MDD3838456.1 2-dehydro-3-deoxygalactonokinase [Phenylobacterium sp.]MDX9999080.1 2-dehydro-3-deoxygalactonokinase [Phenylobacterium sp.]
MAATPALLACDWGTTNLRAWTLDADGAVLVDRDFPLGVSKLAPGEAARRFEAEVRPAMQGEGLPAVMCGMIGSNLGWVEIPYLDCPAAAGDLGAAMAQPAPGVRIAPGLRCPGLAAAPDVMRGEEVQVFGWLAADAARRTGRQVVCHPGTHAKWILIEDGRIVRFVTAMTGELFAVLRRHSILRSDADPDDPDAFDEGVVAAGDGGALAARLFTARARVVGQGAPAESTPAYLSGVLIGAETASLPELLGLADETPIALLGDPGLTRWYARALTTRGREVSEHDGEAAAIAGLSALAGLEGVR